MENQEQIFQIFIIWEDSETWVVSAIWVETKISNSLLMDRIWEAWEEWIQVKYSQCLWEEEEDSEVLEISDKEENQLKKHHKLKEMVKIQKNLVDFRSMTLILITLEVQDSDRLVSKKINNKDDCFNKFSLILLILTKVKQKI